MIAQQDGNFVNLARLNIDKYASDPTVNRYLFEYVFLHEGDMKVAHQVCSRACCEEGCSALQIAAAATRACEYSDWYWKNQLGKCYYRYF